jgi:hypothetical protein
MRSKIWLALPLVVTFGCKKPLPVETAAPVEEPPAGKAMVKAPKVADKENPDADDRALAEKTSLYVRECLNAFGRSIFDSEARYLSWVDPKTGPTGKERQIYGVLKPWGDPKKCRKAVDDAKAKGPKDAALHGLAEKYATAVEALVPTLETAHRYYDRKDYVEDRFAKGKELHPTLVAGFESFAKADAAFGARVSEIQEDLDLRDLARLEKSEGRKARWHVKKTLLTGKALVAEAKKDFAKLDPEALAAAVRTYEEAVEGLSAIGKSDDPDASNVSSYTSSSEGLLKVAKDTLRRKRDGKPMSKRELANWTMPRSSVDGSPAKIVAAWNDVVDSHNRILWARR